MKSLPVGALLALAVAACNILAEGDPEQARVILTAQGTEQAVLIVSNDFDVDVTGQGASSVFLRTADTLSVTTPFEQVYPVGSRLRFFASVVPPDSLPILVKLEIFIDGDERFSQERPVDSSTPMEFLYVFANPVI